MPSPEPSRSTSFATDVLKLVTGTTFAQIIAVLASPLLTRLHEPGGPLGSPLSRPPASSGSSPACATNSRSCSRRPTGGRKPAGALPPLCGSGQRADGASPVLRGRRDPLPPQGARAWFIPCPGFAVCLHQRGFPRAELLELAHQAFRATLGCPGHQFACCSPRHRGSAG